MAIVKKKESSKEEGKETPVEVKKERSFVQVPLPKFKFSPSSYTPFLVVLLMIASYLLGALTTKVSYLEKGGVKVDSAQANAVPTTDPAAAQAAPPPPSGKVKEVTDADHIRGNKDAKVTVIEFSDLECPFCKQYHPTALELLKEYGDRVKFVWRHYPLPFHQNAQKEAEASECVNELAGNDTFWKYVDTVFDRTTSNGTGFALDKLGPLAAELGVDQTAFQTCLDSDKYAQKVKDDIADGSGGGVSGTPTMVILDAEGKPNVQVGAQDISTFKTILDAALKS